MRIQSKLSVKEYLRAMRGSLDPMFDFGTERLIGTILGPFFSVTYCSGYEWNRRVTNEKNRAIGFVRERDGGTEVCFVRLNGMTNPISLCTFYLACIAIFAVKEPSLLGEPAPCWVALACTAVSALATAIQDSITERGQEGGRILMRFLHNPENFSRW